MRVFSSADDVKRPLHPILDRTLDIIAGPADPVSRVDTLLLPNAVTTDSNHRVFVADPGAKGVHVFDFIRSKYSLLGGDSNRLQAPISLAVDSQDNLYVVDQIRRIVLIYDSAGRFRRYLGKLRGKESYFDSPAGIAIDKATGRVYVSDRQRHMIFILDQRGRLIRKLGTRGGGEGPAEFNSPGQIVVTGGELFLLDAGNRRVQILDLTGNYLRAISLASADERTGLAVDGHGDMYVSDPVLNRIQVFGHDGQRLGTFDPATIKHIDLKHPSGMWIDAGHYLYVVDSPSRRIGIFQINGNNPPH